MASIDYNVDIHFERIVKRSSEVDLYRNGAGELVAIDLDFLLLDLFANARLSWSDKGDNQFLHLFFLVERVISEFSLLNNNIHILAFDCNRALFVSSLSLP